MVNSDLWRSASVPAVNLHATAMAIARFYQELMTRPIGATMATAQFEGVDLFIGSQTVWGLGVQLEPDGSWGMGGLGGNAGWADPGRGQAIAYVTRQLGDFAAVDRIETALAWRSPKQPRAPRPILDPRGRGSTREGAVMRATMAGRAGVRHPHDRGRRAGRCPRPRPRAATGLTAAPARHPGDVAVG